MTSTNANDEPRAAPRPDEDPREAGNRQATREEQRVEQGEPLRAERHRRTDGTATGAPEAPVHPRREHQEAPGAEPTPPDSRPMDDDRRALVRRRESTEPDVLLEVPRLKVDEISLDVESLSAHVSVAARVGNLVQLTVGAEAQLGRLNLSIKGVEARAFLEVYLEKVYATVARTLATLDRNPELLAKLLEPVGQAVASVGRTAENTVPRLGEALDNTVENTVPQLGRSLGNTVERTVPGLGKAAGRTVPEFGGDGARRRPSRVVPPIAQAAHRIATRARHAVDTVRQVARMPRRGTAVLRDAAHCFRPGAVRR